MSKYHYINSDFWSDTWVVDHLNPLDRYLYIYLFTNRYTNMVGAYELSLRIMSFETGIEKDQLVSMLRRLQPKVNYVDGWVVLRNGIKNQNYKNEKIKAGINRIVESVPSEILQHVSWPKDFGNPKPAGSKQTKLIDDLSIGHTSTEQNRTELEPVVPTVRSKKPVSNPQPKTTTATTGKNYFEIDLLYKDLQDLVNDRFKAWYCQVFYKLGRDKVLRLASEAKADGKDPVKLFSHLLAKESGVKQDATPQKS